MPAPHERSPLARRVFFALLYFAEGAPIGYIWWAMPTRLREAGVPVEQVASLVAMLALPWAFKFLWAPAVDRLRGPRWGFRAWITVAQVAMGLTLLPLSALPLNGSMALITWLLLAHAVSAATQDVAIDALAISSVPEHDRARTTGWMQAGMLVGRATFGGLALAAEQWIGAPAVIFILVGCIWFVLAAVWAFPNSGEMDTPRSPSAPPLKVAIPRALRQRTLWVGLGIALTAGAGFEAVGGLIGPFLLDHGATQTAIGVFFALPVVVSMIVGGLVGGVLADRVGHRTMIGLSVVAIACGIVGIVAADSLVHAPSAVLMAVAIPVYLGVGCLVASSYALFMDLSDPAIGGTQFSAFMGATNLCEVWAVALTGFIAAGSGYGIAFLTAGSLSLLALPLLGFSRPAAHRAGDA